MQTAQNDTAAAPVAIGLDLSTEGVLRHWKEHKLDRLIAAMERCEPWAIDVRPEFRTHAEGIVEKITRSFNAATPSNITKSVATEPALAIELMGYLRSGRALKLFAWLTQVNPDITRYLVNEARFGVDDFGSIFFQRISTLERQHLLSRVLSPERIALVIELLAEAGIGDD